MEKNINEKYDFRIPKSQADMEEFFEYTMHINNEVFAHTIDGMFHIEKLYGSFEKKELTMEFIVKDWQLNRGGNLQGGMYVVAMDMTTAALVRCFYGINYAPTTHISTQFLSPVQCGDTIVITATAVKFGRRLATLNCITKRKSDQKPVASCSATFMTGE